MLYFFPEPRPYTRADDSLEWKPALQPLPPGVVNMVNMYNLENILNIMNLTKKPFDPPPNAKPVPPPMAARSLSAAAAADDVDEDEDGVLVEGGSAAMPPAAEAAAAAGDHAVELHPALAAKALQVSDRPQDEAADQWYRPHPGPEALSGHCDNYIEAISYYTFVENSNGVHSVLSRAGRENVYKTLMW
eukprot:SAG22_NODE_1180_length_5238_cov_2.463125_4_plen_189_part_00